MPQVVVTSQTSVRREDKKSRPNRSGFFVGTQAHPELKSSLLKPAPLFKGLVGAALKFDEINQQSFKETISN